MLLHSYLTLWRKPASSHRQGHSNLSQKTVRKKANRHGSAETERAGTTLLTQICSHEENMRKSTHSWVFLFRKIPVSLPAIKKPEEKKDRKLRFETGKRNGKTQIETCITVNYPPREQPLSVPFSISVTITICIVLFIYSTFSFVIYFKRVTEIII